LPSAGRKFSSVVLSGTGALVEPVLLYSNEDFADLTVLPDELNRIVLGFLVEEELSALSTRGSVVLVGSAPRCAECSEAGVLLPAVADLIEYTGVILP
jgi:hypothetical protein